MDTTRATIHTALPTAANPYLPPHRSGKAGHHSKAGGDLEAHLTCSPRAAEGEESASWRPQGAVTQPPSVHYSYRPDRNYGRPLATSPAMRAASWRIQNFPLQEQNSAGLTPPTALLHTSASGRNRPDHAAVTDSPQKEAATPTRIPGHRKNRRTCNYCYHSRGGSTAATSPNWRSEGLPSPTPGLDSRPQQLQSPEPSRTMESTAETTKHAKSSPANVQSCGGLIS